MLVRKKWDDELIKLTNAVKTAAALARELMRIPDKETELEMVQRVSRWEAAEAELTKAQAQ